MLKLRMWEINAIIEFGYLFEWMKSYWKKLWVIGFIVVKFVWWDFKS